MLFCCCINFNIYSNFCRLSWWLWIWSDHYRFFMLTQKLISNINCNKHIVHYTLHVHMHRLYLLSQRHAQMQLVLVVAFVCISHFVQLFFLFNILLRFILFYMSWFLTICIAWDKEIRWAWTSFMPNTYTFFIQIFVFAAEHFAWALLLHLKITCVYCDSSVKLLKFTPVEKFTSHIFLCHFLH